MVRSIMYRALKGGFIIAGLLMAISLLAAPLVAQENLLTNPGFEEPFVEFEGSPARQVAEGWTPWHIPPAAGAPSFANRQPEYNPVAPARDRIRSGSNAQEIFSFFATHNGGVYQRVTQITPGDTLRFSVYAYVWSTTYDEREVSEEDGDVTVEVGIDPTGGTDPTSINIVWSPPIEQYNAYSQYVVETTATSDSATVFVRTIVGVPVKHNAIYLDDAAFVVTSSAEVTATSTSTTQPATVAPTETDMPASTATPIPQDASPTPEGAETAVGSIATATTVPPTTTFTSVPPTASPTVVVVATTAMPIATATTQPATMTFTPLPPAATATFQPTSTPLPPTVTTVAPVQPTVTQEGVVPPSATPLPTSTRPPITDEFPQTITHVVQRGDTVVDLAVRYGSTVDAIAQANGLGSNYLIFVGQSLIIPVRSTPATPTPIGSQPELPPGGTITYQVRAGDNLSRIARLYNTTVNAIAQLNGIVNINRLEVGQQLLIPVDGGGAGGSVLPPITSQRVYTVRTGDTLSRISLLYGVPISAIVQANNLTQPTVFVGQSLNIP